MVNTVRIIEPTKVSLGYKLRVCAYARVSTDSEEQLNSYSNQISHYTEKICSNEMWEMVGIFTDEGITGTDMNKRDGFLLMLKECRKGRIDKILTKSISRFARNTQEAIEVIRELRMLGISIEFEKEHIDTEKLKGDWTIEVLSAMAQAESISISQNMRWSYKKRMMQGNFCTNIAPYGFRLINKKLEIYMPEATVVKTMFYAYLNGMGTNAIAKWLVKKQIRKSNGNINWTAFDVSRILKNEKYVGDTVVQKTYTTEVLPFRCKPNRGEKDKYYIKDSHKGFIEREIFEKVNELLKERSEISLNKVVVENCFNRIIKCNKCGSTMYRKNNTAGSISWRCYLHGIDKEKCDMPLVAEEDIKRSFSKMCSKLKNNKYILNEYLEVIKKLKNKATNSNEIIRIESEIQEIVKQNLVLNRLRSKEYIDSAIFIAKNNENNQKIRELMERKRSLVDSEEFDEKIRDIENLMQIIDEYVLETEFNEALFKLIVKQIFIKDAKIIGFILHGGIQIVEEA